MFCQVLRIVEREHADFEYGCRFLELTEEDQPTLIFKSLQAFSPASSPPNAVTDASRSVLRRKKARSFSTLVIAKSVTCHMCSGINELITKILVGDKRRVNGEKVQSIEIHYRFIGNLTDSGNGETIQ